MSMRNTATFLFLTLSHIPAMSAADKVLLLPHWEVGKTYKQETVTDIKMSLPGLGEAGGQNTSITQQLNIAVGREPGSDRKLAEVRFAGIKGTVNMLGQAMTYDSADPAKSPPFLQQTFGALVGKSFTLAYDKDDKFLDVHAPEGLAGTPLGSTKALDGKQLADAFRKSQELALPKEPAAPGDSWSFDDRLDMPPVGAFAIKARGRYDSMIEVEGRKHAKLLLDGTFESPAGGTQVVQFGSGSRFSGEILFDLDRKVVATSVVKTELKLTIGGRDAPMSQTVTTKLTGIEDSK